MQIALVSTKKDVADEFGDGEKARDFDAGDLFASENGKIMVNDKVWDEKCNRIAKPVVSVKYAANKQNMIALAEDGSVHLLVGDKDIENASRKMREELAAMNDVIAVDLSTRAGIGLREDGSVLYWRDPREEILEAPKEVKDIVAVQASSQMLTLDSKGKLYSWPAVPGRYPFHPVPENIGPTFGIRANFGIYAAQLENGMWRAWGNPGNGIVDFINNEMGPAIDLDFEFKTPPNEPPTATVWWIESPPITEDISDSSNTGK